MTDEEKAKMRFVAEGVIASFPSGRPEVDWDETIRKAKANRKAKESQEKTGE